jgi:hypothetical protein
MDALLWLCLFVLALLVAIPNSKGQPGRFAALATLYVAIVSILYLAVLHPDPIMAYILAVPP